MSVSVIGFGAWGIGGQTPGATSYGPTDDNVSRRALETAFDNGITFFDTSGVYGLGKSETLIGEVFAGRRDKVVIATKAGLADYNHPADFSPSAIRFSVEESLTRLQCDYIDLLQLHNPVATGAETDAAIDVVLELVKEGKVRLLGVSAKSPKDGLSLLARQGVDALQTNLNLLDQRARECGLLSGATEAAVGIIARTPLCFGFLSGEYDETTTFDSADHRSRWPSEQIEQWLQGGKMYADTFCADGAMTPSQLALRYCLSEDAVCTVIPGILTPEQAVGNAGAGNLGALDDETLSRIHHMYREISFTNQRPRQVPSEGDSQ